MVIKRLRAAALLVAVFRPFWSVRTITGSVADTAAALPRKFCDAPNEDLTEAVELVF